MNPAKFPQSNLTLRRPDGMTEAECGDLDVLDTGAELYSLWRPSFVERLSVLFFGRVWLVVAGRRHPPVAVFARRNL